MNGGRAVAFIAAISVLAAAAAWSFRPRHLEVELGGFDRPTARGDWERAHRVEVDADTAGGDRTAFYARPAGPAPRIDVPFSLPAGPLRLSLRATARVRATVDVFVGTSRLGEVLVPSGRWDRGPGPWATHVVEAPPPAPADLDLHLVVRAAPLVRRVQSELDDPQVLVDRVLLESPAGFVPAPGLVAAVGATTLATGLFVLAVGGAPLAALLSAATAALGANAVLRLAPLTLSMALPRLWPAALLAGAITALALRAAGLARRDRARLASLVAAGVVAHGAVAFLADHNPPDLDIHVRRTLDLGRVPLAYEPLMRYASQLPTASQDQGAATAALGERTLIPYSPLPYVFYYALHRAGLDLYWAMTVANAALAMLVAPLVWLAARRLWDVGAAWTAVVLYTLDLAVWHHVGRSHAPAVFGGALATAALLHLAAHADRLGSLRARALAAGTLALAVLGYSSLAVLVGLFGLVLLALLAADASGIPMPSRRGLAVALLAGGLLAGALFYFHYVPGLWRGAAGVEAEPDLFPGRTFLVFHNESRQSLRLWVLGLWVPLGLGLLAAPLALRRAAPFARPVLGAWLAAWGLIMLLKEPWLFPRLLRWAKEDQFVSPLMALLLAGAIAAIPDRRLRLAATAAVIGALLALEARDFAHHANTLRL